MILQHDFLDNNFEFNGKINVLNIEDKATFFDFCNDFNMQVQGEDGKFSLYKGESPIDIRKHCFLFSDLFSLDINDKKLLTKFYNKLKIICDEKYTEENAEIITRISSLLEKLNSDSEFEFEYDLEFNISDIFKLTSVKFNDKSKTLLEKICDMISILHSFAGVKIFAFVNLKNFLSDEDLQEFYKFVIYGEFNVFLLEHTFSSKNNQEFSLIIDKDLCEILA